MLTKKSQFTLLLLPLILVATGLFLNHARGPYWLGNNLDPEYVYLLNGLNLAQLKGVGHIDHPGTPVQMMAALTIRIVYALTGPQHVSIEQDVLTRPEVYLEIINRLEIVLNALMILIIGLVAYRLTQRWWWSIWLQFAPFLSPVLLQFGLTRVTPEPMLFFASSAVVLMALLTVFQPERIQRHPGLLWFGWAITIGFGIACKITFLPLLVIPLIALPGLKQRLFYLLSLGPAFVFFTLPIIRMYPQFFSWLSNLIGHTGHYGSGPAGILPVGVYTQNLQTLVMGHPFFSIVLVLALLSIPLFILWPRLRSRGTDAITLKLVLGIALAQLLGLLMVAKHAALHYLLPPLNLTGVLLFLIYAHGRKKADKVSNPAAGTTLAFIFFLFIGISTILLNPWAKIRQDMQNTTHSQEVAQAIHQQVEKDYEGYAKIYYYRCSAPEFALKFGSDLSRSYHAALLDQLYPNIYFYDIWTNRFSRFDYNQSFSWESIQAQYGERIVFQGTRGQKIPGLTLRSVATVTNHEGIYLITPQPQVNQ